MKIVAALIGIAAAIAFFILVYVMIPIAFLTTGFNMFASGLGLEKITLHMSIGLYLVALGMKLVIHPFSFSFSTEESEEKE